MTRRVPHDDWTCCSVAPPHQEICVWITRVLITERGEHLLSSGHRPLVAFRLVKPIMTLARRSIHSSVPRPPTDMVACMHSASTVLCTA